jgi:hypothetical protein
MDNTLSKLLYAEFPINPKPQDVTKLERYVYAFETSPGHPEALGAAALGIAKAYFLPKDTQELFNLFNIPYDRFKRIAHSADEVNTAHIVTSDPFNILTIWLAHCFDVSKLSLKQIHTAKICLFKMMQYRIFTSVVNYNLPHGANEGIMLYTIDHLNNKFTIRTAGSWKQLIEEKSEDIIGPKGIHYETIRRFAPDNRIMDAISDIQTRLRKQLVLVIQQYYTNHSKNLSIYNTSMVEEINGDSMLRAIESSLETMPIAVANSTTNLTEFLDYEFIKIAVGLSNDISAELFTKLLTRFSALASTQRKSGKHLQQGGSKSAPLYIGYELLIKQLIQKTYRQCMLNATVNMGSKVAILQATRNLYSSSRILDPDILAIKESMQKTVVNLSGVKREITNNSLRIALILYFMLLSFKHLK